MAPVHMAVTREVKPGMEQVFETALRNFARESLQAPGMTGVHLIAPVPGTHGCEYGILRSFESEAASSAFYASPLFTQWQEQVQPLVVGDPIRRKLTGLEAFFRDPRAAPPPRWKMGLVTWLGVFPTALVWSKILPQIFGGLHFVFYAAILNVFVVVTLAWVVMPILTRFLATWLRSPAKALRGPNGS